LTPGVFPGSLSDNKREKERPMPKAAARVVDAVYEDGVFRPVRKVALPNQSRVRLTLVPVDGPTPKAERARVARQRKALLAVAGLAASGETDISEHPHAALYGTRRTR
jgi:predicted DNA-binding antitoxin AbrB/MazE fold protein